MALADRVLVTPVSAAKALSEWPRTIQKDTLTRRYVLPTCPGECSIRSVGLTGYFLVHVDQVARCHLQRPVGTIGNADERAGAAHLQSVRREANLCSVASLTLSKRNDFVEIMEMLDKRLNDKGKNWRHVFKVRMQPELSCDVADLCCRL